MPSGLSAESLQDPGRHRGVAVGISVGLIVVIACAVALLLILGGRSSGNRGSGSSVPRHTSATIRLLSYGSDPLQQIKAYPAARNGSPLVVLVHGGGWHSELHEFMSPEAMDLQQAGFAVFDVNYRSFTPTGAFPREIDDVVAATRLAINDAASFNADSKAVTMIGGSAGGQLVASASQTLNSTPGTIAKVVTLSAPTDFATLVHDGETGTLSANGLAGVEQGLGCTAASCTSAQETPWSPALTVTSTNCPAHWLIINSTNELIPVEQATGLATALHSIGCAATVVLNDGENHAYAAWPLVRDKVIAFVGAS